MSKFLSVTIYVCAVLFLVSCTRNDAQREFEKQAYTFPENFTETTNQGAIQDADQDDWRTSPLFQGLVEIVPPYPNPANTSQAIQFEVNVTGVNSLNGLIVMTRFDNNSFRTMYQNFEALPQGLTTFQINPIEFAEFGNVEGARGLNRVYIFNGNQQMITYGDIMVE